MADERLKVVIDRSRWIRGGIGDSLLLRPSDKKMCCLGFVACAVGLGTEIYGAASPENVLSSKWPKGFVEGAAHITNTNAIAEIMTTNDDTNLRGEQREKQLIVYFGHLGIDIEFVDELPVQP